MPMIDLTMAEDALDTSQTHDLVGRITEITLYWLNSMDPDLARDAVWVFVHRIPSSDMFVAGEVARKPRYRVEVRTLSGGFSSGSQAGFFRDVTRAILETEGAPVDFENAERVWLIFQTVDDGGWGMGGRTYFSGGYRSAYGRRSPD